MVSCCSSQALKDEALRLFGEWHEPNKHLLEATTLELVSGYPVYDRALLTSDMLFSFSSDAVGRCGASNESVQGGKCCLTTVVRTRSHSWAPLCITAFAGVSRTIVRLVFGILFVIYGTVSYHCSQVSV
jgi:hypothetical protein